MLGVHILPVFLSSVIVLFYPMIDTIDLFLELFTSMAEFCGFLDHKIEGNSIGKFSFPSSENRETLIK